MGWLLLLAFAVLARAEETCLSVDEDPYLLFGTKTAYIFSNRGLPNSNRAHDVPGCEAVAFWLLNRHGSTKPQAGELDELHGLTNLRDNVVNNYKNGNFRNTNHRICTSDVNLLERWAWNPRHNATFAGDLTSDGYMNTQQLAQAWRQKYPGMLTDNRHNYLFKFVNDQLSSTSFRAFSEGLLHSLADGYDLPKDNDEKTLRPYKFCDAWTKNVEENPETLAQREIFESKREYKEMLTNVSQRLGFNYDMEAGVVRAVYQMCRYNKAWDVAQISPWCAAFTKEDLKRLEYAEDLETYFKYGPGTDLNRQVGCAYVKDMITFFKKHVDSETPQQPRASIHLTEAAALMLAINALGARADAAPLTGDNFRAAAARRRWAGSALAPYNGNLAAVLYKCTLNGNFQINDKYQVLFLENEKPISLEGCRVGLCEWSRVVSSLGAAADACDLNECNAATNLNYNIAVVFTVGVYFLRLFTL